MSGRDMLGAAKGICAGFGYETIVLIDGSKVACNKHSDTQLSGFKSGLFGTDPSFYQKNGFIYTTMNAEIEELAANFSTKSRNSPDWAKDLWIATTHMTNFCHLRKEVRGLKLEDALKCPYRTAKVDGTKDEKLVTKCAGETLGGCFLKLKTTAEHDCSLADYLTYRLTEDQHPWIVDENDSFEKW